MTEAPQTWSAWLARFGLADLVRLPEAAGAQPWQPTDADRAAAWELYTELRTRITTQPLHYRAGDEEAALTSVADLFGTTRALLRAHRRDCAHFATLSVFVLNQVVRPFTAHWHRMLVNGRLRTGDDRHQFRLQLRVLQGSLRQFMTLLGALAQGPQFVPGTESGSEAGAGRAAVGPAVPFGILFDASVPADVQGDMRRQEGETVLRRRQALGLPAGDRLEDVAGLALSGGGIRSATFALGVVQQLAEHGLLPEFDYLSTVSGGGYLGAFLSSYLNDPHPEVGPCAGQLPFRPGAPGESAPLRHLRNRSKSLIEAGPAAKLRVVAQALYGVALSLAAVAPLVVLAAVAICYGRRLARAAGEVGWAAALWALGGWGLAVLLLPLAQRVGRGYPPTHWYKALQRAWERLCFLGFLAVLAAAGVGLLLAGYTGYEVLAGWWPAPAILLAALGLAAALTVLSFVAGWGRLPGRLLLAAAGLAWPLLLLAAGYQLAGAAGPDGGWLLWAALAGTSAYALLVLDVNLLSPHRYYRDQLAKTYLVRRRGGPDGVERVDPQPLSRLLTAANAPYHLINAAVNVPGSRRADLRGRNVDFFLFSKHFCGSPTTGYRATAEFEAGDAHLDLGTAMAISGAAVSTQMGTGTVRQLSFLLGLLNLRLGYWLRNPARPGPPLPKLLRGPGAWYLVREMVGWLDERMNYLNVSDGGHLENLGVYELLRRKCKFIVCIDGEADPTMCFASLMRVVRYAAIDLGVAVELGLEELRLQASRHSLAHFTLGRVRYGPGEEGLLLYVKSSLTGNELEYVLDYQARHETFPHESTAQQLFDEAQFEAYRALGYHVGGDLFRPELVGARGAGKRTLRGWFAALAENLLGPG